MIDARQTNGGGEYLRSATRLSVVIWTGIWMFSIAVMLFVSARATRPAEPEATLVPQPPGVISPENADQLTELARWGNGNQVNCLAFSPDGQTLAAKHVDVGIQLWRVADGTRLGTIDTPSLPDTMVLALHHQHRIIRRIHLAY